MTDKENENAMEMFTFRLPQDELESLRAEARRAGMPMSHYLRALIRGERHQSYTPQVSAWIGFPSAAVSHSIIGWHTTTSSNVVRLDGGNYTVTTP
jgi:hypothetical protein